MPFSKIRCVAVLLAVNVLLENKEMCDRTVYCECPFQKAVGNDLQHIHLLNTC